MTKRSPAAVVILSLVTFGIYYIIWFVKTKREMVTQGADIPTAWLLIVPIANLWLIWKWSGGVEHVTRGKGSQAVAFLLMFLLNGFFYIGAAIVQSWLNQAIDEGAPGQLPQARVA